MEHLRVLLVDDEVLALEHLHHLVNWSELGVETVVEARSSEEALSQFACLRPHLVLMDIRMPGEDGLSLSRRFLALSPCTRIALLTGYRDFDCARKAVTLDIAAYVLKHEVTRKTLTQLVGDLTAQWHARTRKECQEHLLNWLEGNRFDTPEALLVEHRSYALLINISTKSLSIGSVTPASNPCVQPCSAAPILPEAESVLWAVSKEHAAYIVIGTAARVKDAGWSMRCAQELIRQVPLDGVLVVCPPSLERNALPELWMMVCPREAQCIFWRRGSLIPYASLQENTKGDITQLYRQMNEILGCIELRDGKRLKESISSMLLALMERQAAADFLNALDWVLHALHRLYEECALSNPWDHPPVCYSAQEALEWVIAELSSFPLDTTGLGYSRYTHDAMRYALDHLSESLSADGLAYVLGISGVHLRHVFKQETGQTLQHYLTDIRIQRAQQLLAEGNYKIYEIAQLVGYHTSQHFSKVFKRSTGMTPLDYLSSEQCAQSRGGRRIV